MAQFDNFFQGWFFDGGFFDYYVGGFLGTDEIARNERRRSEQDVARSRGRFQVLLTAEMVIAELAEEMVAEDSEQAIMKVLRDAMETHHMDWKDDYLQQFLDYRETLPARQEYLERKASEAQKSWLERRNRKLRAH